ncbi:MAG: LPS export ABC transporter periplasmic protein LptC [Rhodospirillaceae bacterium]|nr:LPS export ABC transporter periplasmic protein LptC [Rhodospirillaceae bacterium]
MSATPPPAPRRSPGQHSDAVWQPRRTDVGDAVNRYSRFVGWMRVALPALAGLIVVIVVVVPQFRGDDDRFRIGTGPLPEVAIDTLSMVNARYFGTDADGQPFSITAKGVRERGNGDARVELTAPQADITLNGGPWLSIEAQAGVYDPDAEVLDLTGEVSLFQDKGYEMHTTAATVHLKDGRAESRTAVDTQGPFGHMTSAGIELFDKGEVVVFTGPAHLVLRGTGGGS